MPFSTKHRSETEVTGCKGINRPASPTASNTARRLHQNLFSGIGQAVSVPLVQVLILVP